MRQPNQPKPATAAAEHGDLAVLIVSVFSHPALPHALREGMIDTVAAYDDTRVNFKHAASEAGILRQYRRAEVMREILQHGGSRA